MANQVVRRRLEVPRRPQLGARCGTDHFRDIGEDLSRGGATRRDVFLRRSRSRSRSSSALCGERLVGPDLNIIIIL